MAALQKGIDDIERGDTIPHAEVRKRLLYDTAFAILAYRPFTEPDCTTGSVLRKGRQGKPKSGEVYY